MAENLHKLSTPFVGDPTMTLEKLIERDFLKLTVDYKIFQDIRTHMFYYVPIHLLPSWLPKHKSVCEYLTRAIQGFYMDIDIKFDMGDKVHDAKFCDLLLKQIAYPAVQGVLNNLDKLELRYSDTTIEDTLGYEDFPDEVGKYLIFSSHGVRKISFHVQFPHLKFGTRAAMKSLYELVVETFSQAPIWKKGVPDKIPPIMYQKEYLDPLYKSKQAFRYAFCAKAKAEEDVLRVKKLIKAQGFDIDKLTKDILSGTDMIAFLENNDNDIYYAFPSDFKDEPWFVRGSESGYYDSIEVSRLNRMNISAGTVPDECPYKIDLTNYLDANPVDGLVLETVQYNPVDMSTYCAYKRISPSVCDICERVHENDNSWYINVRLNGTNLHIIGKCRRNNEKKSIVRILPLGTDMIIEQGEDEFMPSEYLEEETRPAPRNQEIIKTTTAALSQSIARPDKNDPLPVNVLLKRISKIESGLFYEDVNPASRFREFGLKNVIVDNSPQMIELSRVFEKPSAFNTAFIRAPMMFGKTKALKDYLKTTVKKNPDIKIMVISFRILFTKEFISKMNGDGISFIDYRKIKGEINHDEHRMIMIQIDSLHRLTPQTCVPDLLIMDESESIFSHIVGETVTSSINKKRIFASFNCILGHAKTSIFMDANLDMRTVHTMKTIYSIHASKTLNRRYMVAYINTTSTMKDNRYKIVLDFKTWLKEALRAVFLNNERIVIPTSSLMYANCVHAIFSATTNLTKLDNRDKTILSSLLDVEYVTADAISAYVSFVIGDSRVNTNAVFKRRSELVVKMYSSETNATMMQTDLENVSEAWSALDILIYTPTITSGISFELPHFDRLMPIFTNTSLEFPAMHQMMGRVRNFNIKDAVVGAFVQGKPAVLCSAKYDHNYLTDIIVPGRIKDVLSSELSRRSDFSQESTIEVYEGNEVTGFIPGVPDELDLVNWAYNRYYELLTANYLIDSLSYLFKSDGSQILSIECSTKNLNLDAALFNFKGNLKLTSKIHKTINALFYTKNARRNFISSYIISGSSILDYYENMKTKEKLLFLSNIPHHGNVRSELAELLGSFEDVPYELEIPSLRESSFGLIDGVGPTYELMQDAIAAYNYELQDPEEYIYTVIGLTTDRDLQTISHPSHIIAEDRMKMIRELFNYSMFKAIRTILRYYLTLPTRIHNHMSSYGHHVAAVVRVISERSHPESIRLKLALIYMMWDENLSIDERFAIDWYVNNNDFVDSTHINLLHRIIIGEDIDVEQPLKSVYTLAHGVVTLRYSEKEAEEQFNDLKSILRLPYNNYEEMMSSMFHLHKKLGWKSAHWNLSQYPCYPIEAYRHKIKYMDTEPSFDIVDY